MTSSLRLRTSIPLPPGGGGTFDHGDVDPVTGRVFVAHTDYATVDVIDPDPEVAIGVIEGCPEGSGVLCATGRRMVFAASRGAGKVLVINPDQLRVEHEIAVGPKPNGLAWDGRRERLLVADVDASDLAARLFDASSWELIARTALPGRPRWCLFDDERNRFLINIRDPASLVAIDGQSGEIASSWPISSSGPHGLDLDRKRGRAFVACDGGRVIVVDLASGNELASIAISGEPDAIWFNAQRQRLYVGIGKPGLLDIVDTDQCLLLDSIATEAGAHTSAFDSARQRLYIFMPQSSAAAVYEET